MTKFFHVDKKDSKTNARLGLMKTAHGEVHTPAFLPIGTRGSVKAVTAQELKFWGAEIVLANTYHLWMRPGDTLIRKAGGLHQFMGWDGPILTDSGGFQVFSLGEKRNSPRLPSLIKEGKGEFSHGRVLEVSDKGVMFRSDIDGKMHLLTPESSIQIQSNLGSDIALVLDFFPGYPFTEEKVKKSVALTLLWAERAVRHFKKLDPESSSGQRLFGIIQGGDFADLRKKCAYALAKLDFPGYAIGGVAVGEPAEVMYRAVEQTIPYLEEEKPRHLLGVGTPEQLVKTVAMGCDLFDCVLPTRNARHGELFVNSPNSPSLIKEGVRGSSYKLITITNNKYKEDFTPPDNTCSCYLCTHHTRAYLRHLFMAGEPLAIRLATMHNLRFYLDLMAKIRRAIKYDSFQSMIESYREIQGPLV